MTIRANIKDETERGLTFDDLEIGEGFYLSGRPDDLEIGEGFYLSGRPHHPRIKIGKNINLRYCDGHVYLQTKSEFGEATIHRCAITIEKKNV